MKTIRAAVCFAFLVLLLSVAARGADLVDNLNQPTSNYYGPIGDDADSNDFLIGQEFTLPPAPTPYVLNQVILSLLPSGGGANITVSIWNVDSNNNPFTEVAVVSTKFVATAGNSAFIPLTNVTLAPGIYYAVAAPTTPADSGWVYWAYAATTNWTGPGSLENSADTYIGSWENYSITNLPQQISIQATAVTATVGLSQRSAVTTLSWPAVLNGFVADSATGLASAAWQPLTNAPVPTGSTNTITNHWPDPARFFRLRQSFAVENLDQPTIDWEGPIGTDNNSNDFLTAQEFTLPAGNYALNKVTLSLIPAYGSGSVTVSIWTPGPDNNPTNKIAVVASQLVSAAGNVNFVPVKPITLTGGNYYIVASPTTPADNAKVGWYWTVSTAWTGIGALGSFADTAIGSWENFPLSDYPFQMTLQVAPVTP